MGHFKVDNFENKTLHKWFTLKNENFRNRPLRITGHSAISHFENGSLCDCFTWKTLILQTSKHTKKLVIKVKNYLIYRTKLSRKLQKSYLANSYFVLLMSTKICTVFDVSMIQGILVSLCKIALFFVFV